MSKQNIAPTYKMNIIGLKKQKYLNTHYLEGIMPYEVRQTPCLRKGSVRSCVDQHSVWGGRKVLEIDSSGSGSSPVGMTDHQ